ncbi:LamG domain-containing protein [Streptomyces sp. NPDC020681]|uniref:LamG domain-containing protein n=1 Tax=Streptomyces sp. NPDC020681 TaxID=3365083 RepID=UPI00378E8971
MIVTLACGLLAGLTSAPAFAASPAQMPAATDQASESARAAASGEPVEVVEERTEYSTTMANPDGTFTLTQSTRPQRARTKDGSWRGIDITLERRADGTVGPKSSVVDLAFSGGGNTDPMISLGSKRGSLSLDWPGSLPEPELAGATATYPEVFKGVDLKLTATAEGYREVLVVKSAEAAANPALEQIKLTAKGDGLNIAAGAGGGLRAIDADGNAAFVGPAGVMWDSAGDAGAQSQLMRSTAVAEEPEPAEDPNRPGEGDASAELPVQVDGSAVAVKPDLELLRGEETVYPVFIDPPMGAALQERTVLSSDGDRFWDFDGDEGVGRCHRVGPWYCDKDHTNRMYFEFAPTNLAGKYVVDADFRAYETWSFSCSAHQVDLWRTNNISEGSSWPGPAHLDKMGDVNVSAGRGTNCTPEQPDSWVEFNDNPSESDENLTSTVRSFADGKFSRLTLMLRAQDETNPDAWKRFDDNAELQINYVPKPGLPSPYGVIPGYGASRHCNPDYDPLTVTRSDPMIEAGAQALVQPTSTAFKGSLRVYFDAERQDPVTKAWIHTWEATSPSTGFDPDGTLESVRTTYRADNILYRVRMRTQSYWTHEGTTSSMASAYTPWCYFKTDFLAPKLPQVIPGSPYTGCTTTCVGEGGPGEPGTFTFKPNAADTDVTGYRYSSLSQPEVKEVSVAEAEEVSFTPTVAGEDRLFVQAKDVRERWGDTTAFKFKVKPGPGEVGRWRFAETPELWSGFVSSDSGTEGARHNAALTGGARWSSRARGGQADYSLALNSTDPAEQQAYASTGTAPVVDTRYSFTVSAWAFLSDATSNRVVLSAPGTQDSAFTLYYDSDDKKWAFNRGAQDKSGTAHVVSYSDAANPPVGVWTHLAGVFDRQNNEDKTDDTIQLFVNGRPQGSPVRLTGAAAAYEPWQSTSGLQFGRMKATGTFQQHFRGQLDEITVWQRALLPNQIRDESEQKEGGVPATELVADWNAELATGNEIQEQTEYERSGLKLSVEGAQLSASAAEGTTLLLDGEKGYASTTGPVVDETGSFSVSARVRVDRAKWEAKPIGYRGMVAGQKNAGESSWALWLTKTDPDDDGTASYLWRFERTAVDGTGTVTAEAKADAGLLSDGFDVPADVTAVFDAAQTDPADPNSPPGKLRLYIGATPQNANPNAGLTASVQGTGELAAGRGARAGTTGHYFPGSLDQLRIWSGALTADGVASAIGAGT